MTAEPSLRSHRVLLLAAAALSAAALAPAQQRLADDRAKGAAAVTVAQCKEWLGTLAGPEFEGRGTGQPGFEKAANYVAAHFKALGLEARGENGTYFQHMPWTVTRVDPDQTFVRFTKGAGEEVLKIPASRLSGSVSDTARLEGECVLLAVDVPPPEQRGEGRRGFVMPEIQGLDDVDVKDKVVVVFLRQQGEQANAMGTFAVTRKLQGKSPAMVLFGQVEEARGGLSARGGGGARNPAEAGARRAPAQLTFCGADFETFLTAAGLAKAGMATAATVTALPLRAEVALVVGRGPGPAMNVFAVLPGSDPAKKDEYVVIGSHLDHLGVSNGRVFPGADDDGSGTTGVMAVAQMFARNPVRPARSILFVCFAGEENGLRGSAFFAGNPPIPLSSIVGELQMDMIGRDEEANAESRSPEDRAEKAENNRNSLHLVGTQKLAPTLHELCLQKNETAKFDLEYDQEGMFDRSDHANFARKGVPVAFFFTGLHRDYHQTSDTPDKIHYEKLLRIATYVYDIAFELAAQPSRPLIDPQLWSAFRSDSGNRVPEVPAAPMQQGGGDKKDVKGEPKDKKGEAGR